MSEQKFTPKYSILTDFRMRLIGNINQGQTKRPALQFMVSKNRPVIRVYTNVDNDKNRGVIEAELDSPTFEVILNMLENAHNLEPGQHEAVKCLDYTWQDKKRSQDVKPRSKVIIGREQDGTIFICVLSWDQQRPVIKFPVRPSMYYQCEKSDGSQMDEATASLKYSGAWARVLRQLVFHQLIVDFTPPEPKDQSGQTTQRQNQSTGTPPGDLPETSGDGWGNDGWSM